MNKLFATGTTGTIGRHFGTKVERISIDLSQDYWSEKDLNISRGDVVIHCAAIVGVDSVTRNEELAYKVNVEATRKLARVARERRVSRFVYVSTAHVYANSKKPITELDPVAPQNLYAQQKYEAEKAVIEELSFSDTEFCIARVFSVLDWDVKTFALGGSIKKLLDNDSSKFLTNCDDIRDFLTPKTISEALLAIAKYPYVNGVINLCSGKGMTVGFAARAMFERSGFNLPFEKTRGGNSSIPCLVGDNSKLKQKIPSLQLTWNPSVLNLNY